MKYHVKFLNIHVMDVAAPFRVHFGMGEPKVLEALPTLAYWVNALQGANDLPGAELACLKALSGKVEQRMSASDSLQEAIAIC